MRIALWVNLPPGGAKRAAHALGVELARGHSLDLYRLEFATGPFDLDPFVGAVHGYGYHPLLGLVDGRLARWRMAPRSRTLFGPLRSLHARIAADIDARGYDAVLVHTDAMTQAPHLLAWLRTPSLYYCQEPLRVILEPELMAAHRAHLRASPALLGRLRVLEDRWVLARLAALNEACARAAGAIAVNSEYSRGQIRAAYGREAQVCPLGVDTARFRPGRGRRRRLVLSVGALTPAKRHDLVIEAIARIPAGGRPEVRIVAPAAGPEAGRLAALASRLGVRLELAVGLPEAGLAAAYAEASVTVCAARREPFGLVVLESLACATPVVAVDEGGFPESVHPGRDGLLVGADPDAVAGAVAGLLLDPEASAEMGRRGRAWVEAERSWSLAAARVESLLASVARGS